MTFTELFKIVCSQWLISRFRVVEENLDTSDAESNKSASKQNDVVHLGRFKSVLRKK